MEGTTPISTLTEKRTLQAQPNFIGRLLRVREFALIVMIVIIAALLLAAAIVVYLM